MGSNFIWWTAVALEIAILFRGVRTSLLKKFSLFYVYITCVLLVEVLRSWCHTLSPNTYPAFYWHSELVTIVASYAISIEIFAKALQHSPGVARSAQKLLLVVFVIALSYATTDLLHGGFASVPRATADLGRYLRYIEGAVLLVMLWLFGHYRIPFGRNLLGLALGYSLLVGLDVVNLALLSFHGNELSVGLRAVLPLTYAITLVTWCASLWSRQPDSARPAENRIERDYDLVAAKTRIALGHLATRVARAIRP